MFYFWREATAALVSGFLCQSGRRRPDVSILSSLLGTATAAKTSLLKWNKRVFKLCRVYSNLLKMSNIGKFSWPVDAQVLKEKENFAVAYLRPL